MGDLCITIRQVKALGITCQFTQSTPSHPRRKKNPEKVKAYTKKWSVNNRGKENARAARYRARKRNQTPENANKIWIDLIYEHCPEGHHVDHIVALANGGLHHEDNLQYLTASENRSKGDR